ncbi:NADP-dependent phosphogluconate dehydrogenase [Candidatus Dependentiae bacterium]|nr:NADP-dependent phosphogluconate dehydrogenase [Candidatus Dependentiae bacterium]
MENLTIGIIGLGRMGLAIAERLVKAGITVFGVDPALSNQQDARFLGIQVLASPQELGTKTTYIWLMVPAGEVVDKVLEQLLAVLKPGSIIIDGGNSFFKDSVRRSALLKAHGMHFIDCGTSGGLHGKELGYSLMIGGDVSVVQQCDLFFKAIAMQSGGYAHVGPVGAGHYVKMVHNGIEYAVLQAYGEGFHLLKEGAYKELDLAAIAKVWNHGSIIRSWIGELAEDVLVHDQELTHISGAIAENKTGQWTVELAREHGIELPVIEKSLAVRAWSRATGGNFATKMVAMLRGAFGGHPVGKI